MDMFLTVAGTLVVSVGCLWMALFMFRGEGVYRDGLGGAHAMPAGGCGSILTSFWFVAFGLGGLFVASLMLRDLEGSSGPILGGLGVTFAALGLLVRVLHFGSVRRLVALGMGDSPPRARSSAARRIVLAAGAVPARETGDGYRDAPAPAETELAARAARIRRARLWALLELGVWTSLAAAAPVGLSRFEPLDDPWGAVEIIPWVWGGLALALTLAGLGLWQIRAVR